MHAMHHIHMLIHLSICRCFIKPMLYSHLSIRIIQMKWEGIVRESFHGTGIVLTSISSLKLKTLLKNKTYTYLCFQHQPSYLCDKQYICNFIHNKKKSWEIIMIILLKNICDHSLSLSLCSVKGFMILI